MPICLVLVGTIYFKTQNSPDVLPQLRSVAGGDAEFVLRNAGSSAISPSGMAFLRLFQGNRVNELSRRRRHSCVRLTVEVSQLESNIFNSFTFFYGL